MAEGRFATVITCMDGRVQEPVATWLKGELGVDYVDTITEAGPDKIVAETPDADLTGLRRKIGISTDLHGSGAIAVVAHHDCGGNPVSREEHLRQLEACVERIASWNPECRVIGLWVNDEWAVEPRHDVTP